MHTKDWKIVIDLSKRGGTIGMSRYNQRGFRVPGIQNILLAFLFKTFHEVLFRNSMEFEECGFLFLWVEIP